MLYNYRKRILIEIRTLTGFHLMYDQIRIPPTGRWYSHFPKLSFFQCTIWAVHILANWQFLHPPDLLNILIYLKSENEMITLEPAPSPYRQMNGPIWRYCSSSALYWQSCLNRCATSVWFFFSLVEKVGNRDYVLTILKASLEDDAEYSVTAKNIAGQDMSLVALCPF